MRIQRLRLSCLCALAMLGASALDAVANSPKVFEVQTHAALSEGTFTGTRLTPRGEVRQGRAFDVTDLKAPTAWAALEHADATWVATGNRAEVLRVTKDGTVQRIATGDEGLMVTALARLPEGAVAAAIAPGGRIVRIDAKGAVTPHAETAAEYVWALHGDTRGGLVAACGTPGQLVWVDPLGGVERTTALPDEHARCLLVESGRTLVGTSPKGLVLETGSEPEVRVIHDFDADEVVALSRTRERGLLVATNSDAAGGNAQMLTNMMRQLAKPNPTQVGQTPPARTSVQSGALIALTADGVETPLWQGKKVALRTLHVTGQVAWLGTEPSARILRLDLGDVAAEPVHDAAGPMQVADLEAAEVSAFVNTTGDDLALVTSNPASLARGRAPAEGESHWTSKVLDATASAMWGTVHLDGAGTTRLEVRSGMTAEPDDTWTAWVAHAAGEPLGRRAQRIQLRIHIGADTLLRGLTVIARTPNRAPTLSGLKVVSVSASEGVPEAKPKRDITWTMKDPDGDTLTCSVFATRAGSTRPVALVEDKVMAKGKTTWDTSGWPDGMYTLRVTVHDAASNAAAETQRASIDLGPVRVDNTAPTVTLTHKDGRIEVTATDAAKGRIHSARVAIDGGPWQPLLPSDGVADRATESFAVDAPKTKGAYIVVQVRDAWGNVGAAALTPDA